MHLPGTRNPASKRKVWPDGASQPRLFPRGGTKWNRFAIRRFAVSSNLKNFLGFFDGLAGRYLIWRMSRPGVKR
jgi:hypothetical protein